MINKIILSGLILLSISVKAQDHLDEIAKKVCSDVREIPDSLDKNDFVMTLGVKMIEAAEPYTKILKKKDKIDLMKPGASKTLGEMIGIRMASVCPEEIQLMAKRMQYDVKEMIEEEISEEEVTGTVMKVEDENFVHFSIKDKTAGRTSKYYWLNEIDTEIDLANTYKSLLGKQFEVIYTKKEFFDPNVGDYRYFRVIKSLKEVK